MPQRYKLAVVRRMVCGLSMLLGGCGSGSDTFPFSPTAPTPTNPAPGPPPVFVRGWVRHTAGGFCEGCLVELLDGPTAGASMQTPSSGQFTFSIPGTETMVTVRASKDGYRPTTTVANATSSIQGAVNLIVESLVPPVLFAGSYTLMLTPDPAACSQLPEQIRTRAYAVSLVPVPERPGGYQAHPIAGNFEKFFAFFFVSGNDLAMHIEDGTNESDGIVEHLSSGDIVRVHVWSELITATDARSIQMPVTGEFSYCPLNVCNVCQSSRHQLTMTRR